MKELALITGGTSGLGENCVKRFTADGYEVVFSGRNVEAGQRIAAEYKAHFVKCDIKNEAEINGLFEQIKEKYGRLDVIVHSAGFAGLPTARTGQIKFKDYREMMDVNLDGSFLVLGRGAELMAEFNNGGRIVSISSGAALNALPVTECRLAHYSLSKRGLNGLTQLMAMEYAEHNIRINAICSGPVKTKLVEQIIDSSPDPAVMEAQMGSYNLLCKRGKQSLPVPEDVSGVCAFLCGPDAKYINGALLPVDGGYHVV